MKTIEHGEVERIAKLAKLRFETSELDVLAHQLTEILTYVEQLEKVDITGIEPLSHVHDLVNQTRPDKTGDSLTQEEALRNAPDADGAYFKVPRVIRE